MTPNQPTAPERSSTVVASTPFLVSLIYWCIVLPIAVIGVVIACWAFPILIPIIIIGWIVRAVRKSRAATAAAVQLAVRQELDRRDVTSQNNLNTNEQGPYLG